MLNWFNRIAKFAVLGENSPSWPTAYAARQHIKLA
jgi:hypothetical protein